MENIVVALTALVQRASFQGKTPPAPRPIRANLVDAPACVRELAGALSRHFYNVDLGKYSLFNAAETSPILDLEHVVDIACEAGDLDRDAVLAVGGPGGAPFDPKKTLYLGADGGGMSTLGISWSGGSLGFVVVETDDPTEDNLLTHLVTAEALLAFLADNEGSADLDALRAAAGIAKLEAPTAPQPREGLRPWDGAKPPHPFARAREHFKDGSALLQAGPTPAGRYACVRRFRAGTPPSATTIAVVGPSGTERTIDWPVPRDAYGVCLVPGSERILVSTGAPGPLVEIDLESGAERELLGNVAWSPGFLDDAHLALLASGHVEVYRYGDGDLGPPVAKAPIDGFNVFVGHGRVFAKTADMSTTSIRVLAFRGGALVEEGVFPLEQKIFALHAASTHDGRALVASVDWKGNESWFVWA